MQQEKFKLAFYAPGNTWVHRLGAGPKIIFVIVLLTAIAWGGWNTVLAAALMCLFLMGAAHIPALVMLARLKSIFWFVAVVVIFPLVFAPGEPLPGLGFLPFEISKEGLNQGGLSGSKLILVFALSWWLLATTHPRNLYEFFEIVGSKFKWTGLPVRDYLLIGWLAFQAIPLLFVEAEKFYAESLGTQPPPKNLIEKIRWATRLFVPFITEVFSRHDSLARQLGYELKQD